MNLDPNNSNSTDLGDDHESRIAPVATSGSATVEASSRPHRENPTSVSGGELNLSWIVCISEYVIPHERDPGPGFGGRVRNLPSRPTLVNAPVAESPPIVSTIRYSDGPRIDNRVAGRTSDEGSSGGGDDSVSRRRVSLLCRFGGLIVPRDSRLIYVGGDAKLVHVNRDVSINEFFQTIDRMCGPFCVFKYQLPGGDLDALVSVASSDDLENMMDEYDRMVERSSDELARLKAFLFSSPQSVSSLIAQLRSLNGATLTRTESVGSSSTGHEKVEEVEGIVDGNYGDITRKEEVEETVDRNGAKRTESVQDSDLNGTEAFDSTGHEKVDEVKGIVDGNCGGIMRKEIRASDTSLHNSDLSEAAAIDITGHEQVEIVEVRHEKLDSDEVVGIVDTIGGGITGRESMPGATSVQNLDLSRTEATRHDEVDIEEVKGILDGNEGGITRRGSMDTAASMNNLDLNRPEAIDSTRHEQVDVEEAKRIVDGNVGGITRRESIASATSMKSSDLNATEAIDSTGQGQGQGDIAGSTSSGGVSSKNNFTASKETAHRPVSSEPSLPMHVEPATDPRGIQAVDSRPPVLPTQPSFIVQPQQQQQAGLLPCAPYFQAYLDPQQEVLGHTEYVQCPYQMVFPSQHSETAVPVLTQHQKYGNVSSVTPNQSIPVPQIPITPNSYANPNPIAVQPITQPQQVRQEHFQEEIMYRPPVQISGDRSHGACHAQVSQSHTISGGYGWHQAPQIEQVPLFDDCWQQVALTADVPRSEESNLCEKALLRTHSDTLEQGQREGPTTTSNFIPVYHSLQPWDQIRGQPVSASAPTATLPEGITKDQVTEAPQAPSGHLDHDHILLKPSVPQCAAGDPHSLNSLFIGTTPQLYQKNVSQEPMVPMQHKAKEVLYNPEVIVAPVEDTSSQVPNHLVNDSSKEHAGKQGILEPSFACDQLKQIDSGVETFGVPPSGVLDNEQIMLPAGNSEQKNIMDSKAYQTENKTPYIDNSVNIPQTDFGATFYKQKEKVPYCEVTQPPLLGFDPAQVANRSPPVCELKHNASQCCSKIDGDVEVVHIDGNNYYKTLANRVGDMQDKSNSGLSSEDPQNLQHDLPPRPNEILTRNEAHIRDRLGNNRFGSSGEPATRDIGDFRLDLLTVDGVHLPSEEEHIKHELQAVTEGVAVSVPQTCVSVSPASQDSIFQNNDEVLDANKAEDMKLKLSERVKSEIPVLDGVGGLQKIEYSDLEELQELDSGTVGTVYYGKWRGSDVAIKRINDRCFAGKPSEQERMRADFWNEVIKLADLHHPNVVALYGVARDNTSGSWATVTEFMVNGSLKTVLQKEYKNLEMGKRLLIAKEIAYGMEYLHGKNIVHFDLKSDNLLVSLLNPHRPVCKVGDLGLSKFKRQTLVSGRMRGTLPWMAPELLHGSIDEVSEKVDVFSFGIVLWELLTGEEPYRGMHDVHIIGGIMNNNLRPPVPDSCDPEWRSLMERCWSEYPSERPSFTEVVSQLQNMDSPPKVQAEQQPISIQPQVKTERV
ncbi:uncharacterized protein LOC141704666 [Apium graveolens]|uniref:uncharacterized protein LOC141704666 n=1 Tax=Apium graveolens TaxID=4045 RepID=UPI003D7ADA4B